MKIAAAWAALAILTTGFIGQSESFHNCEKSRKDHSKYEALHRKGSAVIKSIVRFELHVACAVETTHENEGPLTLLATILIAGFTGTLWFETNRLYQAGEKQIDAVKVSTNVAERSLVAAQRAWVKIDVSVNGGIGYDNLDALNIKLLATVKNTGNSPATDVDVKSISFLGDIGNVDSQKDYVIIRDFIESKSKTEQVFGGHTLFPDETKEIKVSERIGRRVIDEATSQFRDSEGIPFGFISPYIVGLVIYRIPFDNKVHHTGFAVRIGKRMRREPVDPDDLGMAISITDRELVRAKDVWLTHSPFGSPTID